MEPRPLSKEELQTLRLFANGLSTEEIAERLNAQKTAIQDRLRVVVRERDDMHTRIRERAYQIWLNEGKPHGSDKEHWARAEAEVRGASFLPENAFDPKEIEPR